MFKIVALMQDGDTIVKYRVMDSKENMRDCDEEFTKRVIRSGCENAKIEHDTIVVDLSSVEIIELEPMRDKSKAVDNDKIARMKELVPYLAKCAYVYEQENRELISNYEYDKLYDELVKLEAETGITLANSVTQNVGYAVSSKLLKVQHGSKMLSLDKTKSVEALKELVGNNNKSLLSWKLDGLTIVVTYQDGKLVSAVTRGNGLIGEDVTNNYRVFSNVPLTIDYKERLVLRGEAIITYSQFEKINAKLADGEKYKNPRNLCSGSVRQLDPKITKQRGVKFIGFGVLSCMHDCNSKSEKLQNLAGLGFDIVQYLEVNSGNMDRAVKFFEDKVADSDFPSDGLVLTIDDIEYSKSLGETSKFPKDSLAFKWKDEVQETKLIRVEWSTSRTGDINPIAIFEPVDLEGTTVERASLHNVSILEDLELGIGDRVTVYKANMIIPQILDNLTRSDDVEIPKHCPVCGGRTCIVETLSKKDGIDRVVKVLKCTNLGCRAQLIRLLSHFVSRDAMNIDGLSEATLERFVEEGLIKKLSDIYSLSDHEYVIVNMPGFGEKSYNNLMEAIEKSREVGKQNFIYALGIPNVGLNTAKLLLKHYGNDIEELLVADVHDLMEIDGLGPIKATDFADYMSDEEKFDIVKELLVELTFKADMVVKADSSIAGKNFVVTGDVKHYKNRKELSAHIESLGGKVSGSVSSKTDYLINNDINSTSSKNKNANKLGIPIISEEDFMAMI